MFADYIMNLVMKPKNTPFEETEAMDRKAGFVGAFHDYHQIWERVPFEVRSDDIVIKGEYAVNPEDTGERKKVCILCHGQTVSRAGAVKYAKMFYDMGYSIVLFDQRYFGETGGEYCTLGWKEAGDVKKVIEFTRSVFGYNCFLGLHGESEGAACAISVLDTEKPDFVVADCPFSDLGELIHDQAVARALFIGSKAAKEAVNIGMERCGFDYRTVRPMDSLKDSEVPVLFMHGKRDRLINWKHSKRMYLMCKNPLSRIYIFPRTDHARSVFNYAITYKELMEAFVKEVEASSL